MRRQELRFKALRGRLPVPRRSRVYYYASKTLGKEKLGAVVVMGSAQWPGANQESGGNNQGLSVGNIERCCFGSK